MEKYKKYRNGKNTMGFTLVEVLICVGIIGIIAAISIPAILASTSEKALTAQRKAFHSRMAQAFAQISNIAVFKDGNDVNNSITRLLIALQKTYKISKTCDTAHLWQCGLPDVIYDYYSETAAPKETSLGALTSLTTLNANLGAASDWGGDNVAAMGFRTANGEAVLMYFNPNCKSKKESAQNLTYSVCVNMIYDLNGRNSAPNAYGEDIGYMTVFYPANPMLVAPMLDNTKDIRNKKFTEMLNDVANEDRVPATKEELISILINQQLTHYASAVDKAEVLWSSTYSENSATPQAWTASINAGLDKDDATDTSTATHKYFLLKK